MAVTNRDYRGKEHCILGQGSKPDRFCDWNSAAVKIVDPANAPDPWDRLELCRICQKSDSIRTDSFIGKQLSVLNENLKAQPKE